MTGLCVVKPLGTFITFLPSLDFWGGLLWYTRPQQAAFSCGCEMHCFKAWNISPALPQASPPLQGIWTLQPWAFLAREMRQQVVMGRLLLMGGQGSVYPRGQKGTQWGIAAPYWGLSPLEVGVSKPPTPPPPRVP